MKNLSMLPDYFDYIFVNLRQKVRLRPESNPKLLSSLSPNPARTRPEPGPNPTRKTRPDLQLCLGWLLAQSVKENYFCRPSLSEVHS